MKKKIMVVDDDPENNISLKAGLEEMDPEYEVMCADSAKQCFEMLDVQIPSLILLDIMMPDVSGWEVIKKLKKSEKWRDIPVVFLSARSDSVAKGAGEFLGEDYIEKPYEIADLKRRIDKILAKIS